MTTTPQYVTESGSDQLADKARNHLWMHFTRHSTYYEGHHVPIITKGEGAYIWDDQGKRGTGVKSLPKPQPNKPRSWRFSQYGHTPTRVRSFWPSDLLSLHPVI